MLCTFPVLRFLTREIILEIILIFLIFGRIKNDDRFLLIIRTVRMNEEPIESLVFRYYDREAVLRVKNTTEDSVEFIYELSRREKNRMDRNKQNFGGKSIIDAVYDVGNIEYCNLVMQNDEISG